MLRVVIDRIFGNTPAPLLVERFARIRVHVEAWKVAARNIQPNAVTAFEDERSRVHLNREFVRLTRRERFRNAQRFAVARTDDAVADVEVYATILDQWLGADSAAVLNEKFKHVPVLRS